MPPNDPDRRAAHDAPIAGVEAGLVPAAPEAAALSTAQSRRAVETLRRATDRRVAAIVEGMSDAFLALGPDWRVTYANREAARLNGTTPDALVGQDHWTRWPETRGGHLEREYRRAVAERVPVQFEQHYPDLDVWHDVRAYPADDGGLAVFYRDITALKRTESERERQARELADATERAIAAETQFRLLVDRVLEYAVFLLDPDGVVTYWGAGAERIKGYRPEEIVGKHLRTLYPDEGPAEDGSAEDHLRHAALHGEYIGEGTRRKKGGGLFPARVLLTALRRGGQLVGFSKITQDLTGERERQAALAAAAQAAQEASTAKSQFLANTSHELRTPLNAVMGYAELLELEMAGPLTDAQRQYVGRIQATSRHLLGLVNDILDLSKIEAGQFRTTSEVALVCDAVAAALQIVEPQARAREVALVDGCPRDHGVAYRGDEERVRQVLVNLVSNAVRFTEAGGRVAVACAYVDAPPADARPDGTSEGPWCAVRVEDTGLGIAPEQLERIWDAFVQADAATTRKVGGSGLGLTISRHLARLMGGDITVTSEPGRGSTFTLWLPGAPRAAVARGAPPRGPEESAEHALGSVSDAQGAGLRDLAASLLSDVERVLATYVARLRADPATPSAHHLADAQLEDHGVTLLADMMQCLTIVGQDGTLARRMLRDGSLVQRLLARRHGVQRRRLGWTEAEVRREYEVLRAALADAVSRHAARTIRRADADRAFGVLARFLTEAEAESLTAYAAGEADEE